MKKTVTTILNLALAMILVSSLSSGVILANGNDHDNRNKNKNKYHTEHDVGIMTCADDGTGLPGSGPMFVDFDSNVVDIVLPVISVPDRSCAVNLAFLRDEGFKIQNVNSNLFIDVIFSTYIMERNRRVRN
jgi:hypothetical protein